jgi:hypothetical protein
LNPVWDHAEGRLRLLRGPDNLEDYATEVPPLAGTMLAFRRSGRSFHGHRAHVGERRSLQLNWMTDPSVVRPPSLVSALEGVGLVRRGALN